MSSLDQIKTSIQQGLAAVANVGNTTPSQVKTAMESVLSNTTALHASVKSLPASDIGVTKILAIVPQGVTLAISAGRATSSVKYLSSPLTPDDGTAILATSQKIRDQLIAAINEYATKIPAIEVSIPGLSKFSLSTIQNLTDDLVKAFINAAPPNIPKNTILEIQASIIAAIKLAQARIPA